MLILRLAVVWLVAGSRLGGRFTHSGLVVLINGWSLVRLVAGLTPPLLYE
ncbi:hypothetical protein [Endozoicomonas euniceicola]|uniref:MAPEG family protein n=1 Tax=Endozoicomonas euniceicola TaxID=1234143 RepID=A0ABY6GRH9_9GAMM|nr:hypothetical protein [Endozoicomonas euniceicola]UYM14756.1 hypothetical protein NX720_17935 [Endozoicomonas euniceicola]